MSLEDILVKLTTATEKLCQVQESVSAMHPDALANEVKILKETNQLLTEQVARLNDEVFKLKTIARINHKANFLQQFGKMN